jgi:hypothetical protein
LPTLLGANFVTLVLVGMTIFFFFAMLSWAEILRLLKDGVGLVVLSGTWIFWPSLLHVTRGVFELAILLVTICLAPVEMIPSFSVTLLVAEHAFLPVEGAGSIWLLGMSDGLPALAAATLLVIRRVFRASFLVTAMAG